MIIGISGRKLVGKTTVSNEIISRGFTKVSFADYLKKTCCQLYNLDIEDCYNQETKEKKQPSPFVWDKSHCEQLSKIINETLVFDSESKLETIRNLLQFIGTEVLRKHRGTFHIEKTLESLNDTSNYIFDDIRYVNELEALQKKGAVLIYIIRPNNRIYDNHSSETSLNWSMFKHIIINEHNESRLKTKINCFLDVLLNVGSKKTSGKLNLNKDEFYDILQKNNWDTVKVSKIFKVSRDCILWWRTRYLYNWGLPTKYEYNRKFLLDPSLENAYCAGLMCSDGCLKKSGKSKIRYVLEISSKDKHITDSISIASSTNKPSVGVMKKTTYTKEFKKYFEYKIVDPFIVENAKLWNIDERKSTTGRRVPDMIKNNKELIPAWLAGMIDGDGSICYSPIINHDESSDKSYLVFSFLSSNEVIDFVSNLLSNDNISFSDRKHKGREDLRQLSLTGSNSIKFYEKYHTDFGLPRKWDLAKKFMENVSGGDVSYVENYKLGGVK